MSRIILAIDPHKNVEINELITKLVRVKNYIAGIKIGLPFIVRYGLTGVRSIIKEAYDLEHIILDFKLADIAPIMISTIEPFIDVGINEAIAHAFIGLNGGLQELKEYLDKNNIRLILVISMSHPGSIDVIDHSLNMLIKIAERLKPYGIVVPATRPYIIKMVREKLLSKKIVVKIYSPGIGAQGAEPGSALRAGADYEIIGRTILFSQKPEEIAMRIAEIHEKLVH